jgi:hypothetical protein
MASNNEKTTNPRAVLQEGSRAFQVAELGVGEYLSDAVFLPLGTFNRDELQVQRKDFNQVWSVAMSRAKAKNPKREFASQTFTAVNLAGDICMTLVLQRTK